MRRAATVALLAVLSVGALAGCSVKQVDKAVTGATLVPGTGNLWRFCDGNTLVYYSDWGSGGSDEYEFIVYDGCSATPPPQGKVQNLPDDEGN